MSDDKSSPGASSPPSTGEENSSTTNIDEGFIVQGAPTPTPKLSIGDTVTTTSALDNVSELGESILPNDGVTTSSSQDNRLSLVSDKSLLNFSPKSDQQKQEPSVPRRLGSAASTRNFMTANDVSGGSSERKSLNMYAGTLAREASGGENSRSTSAGTSGGGRSSSFTSMIGKQQSSSRLSENTGRDSTRNTIRRRTSFTMGKLNVNSLGLVGREDERQLILDAYARVSGGGQLQKKVSQESSEETKVEEGYEAADAAGGGVVTETKTTHVQDEMNAHEDLKYPELILVNGYSGVGKTQLVESSLAKYRGSSPTGFGGSFLSGTRNSKKNRKSKLIYLAGKYDQNQQRPYSAIFSAFSGLAYELGSSGWGDTIKPAIMSTVGEEERAVLTQFVPGLGVLFGETEGSEISSVSSVVSDDLTGSFEKVGTIEAKNRLFFVFKKFIASIGRAGCPLVIVLDDLQWADGASLDLIESLVTERSQGVTMIVGTYRSNEVNAEHVLAQKIEKINAAGSRDAIVDITLDNLGPDAVNELVATILKQGEDQVKDLSDVIVEKTMGNPFHVIQLLVALEEEELITFSLGVFKWTWDIEKINEKYVTANVTDLMNQRVLSLRPEAQVVLKVASCLGCQFDKRTLELASDAFPPDFDKSELEEILLNCVSLGILRTLQDNSIYSFCHDQIQTASFSLIPQSQCQTEQAIIGRSLAKHANPEELEILLPVATDLCNCDPSLFCSSKEEVVKFSSLNLRAGKQAMKNSAFISAATYLMAGIEAMNDLPFGEHKELFLELYGLAAQAHYCNGDIDDMSKCIDFVLSKETLPVEDRYPLQMLLCKSLYVRYKYDEAFEIAQQTLKDLGYKPFPKKVSTVYTIKELIKTKMLLRRYDKEKLLSLPMMEDENRLRAVKVFRALGTLTYQCGNPIMPIVIWRWTRWSLRYGLADVNVVAFASHAVILNSMGELKAGYELATISEKLLEKVRSIDHAAFTLLLTNHLVRSWTMPVHELIAPCTKNCEIGLLSGDIEGAMWHLHYIGVYGYVSGKQLVKLEGMIGPHLETIQFYKQDAIYNNLVPYRQLVLNLLGYSNDPLVLTGIAMDQKEFLKLCTEAKQITSINIVHSHRLELAYLFGRFRLASSILDDITPWSVAGAGYVGIYRTTLFQGLTCYAMARAENMRMWVKRGDTFLKMIEKWVKGGNANCVHMLNLLLAERSWIQGKAVDAEGDFGKAISVASQNGFVHDKALAHERFMVFHLQQDEGDYWAKYHYQKACEAWEYYGARAKLDQLKIAYSHLAST